MEKIIIVSRNKGIVSKEELLPLAILLRDSLSVPVEFNTPQHLGTQVTFHDVIEVWVNGFRTSAISFNKFKIIFIRKMKENSYIN